MLPAGTTRFGEYTGSFPHGVDASHRVMIPSDWRPTDPDTVFTMLPWPVWKPECLIVLNPERWTEMVARMKSSFSLADARAAQLERLIYGSAVKVRVDKVGRLCLGEDLRKRLGIGKESVLVGRGDKFEIWDAARKAEYDRQLAECAPETFSGFYV